MERRQFTREFKLEAVRLIKERGVSYAQAAEDLGVHPTQLRDWVKKLADRFGPLLDLAHRVRHQEQRQRGPKVYSLHAPEVECIGKGKARTPYEFGSK